LRGITDAGDALVIGAMTRRAEVERSPPVKQAIPAWGCLHATKDDERQPM
jgi:CO/xanthine dehydrogenase FAD-binding subunit